MKINLLYQNVQGLNDPQKIKIVRNYVRRHTATLDFLWLQEHKLRGNSLTILRNLIWPGAEFYGQEAATTYNNTLLPDRVGSGGMCLWVTPRLIHLIKDSESSRRGRVQCIRLSRISGDDIAILNVDAPLKSVERCELWLELSHVLL